MRRFPCGGVQRLSWVQAVRRDAISERSKAWDNFILLGEMGKIKGINIQVDQNLWYGARLQLLERPEENLRAKKFLETIPRTF